MEILNLEIKNPAPILAELISTLANVEEGLSLYLNFHAQVENQTTADTFLGIKIHSLPEIFNLLGIRAISLRSSYDFTTLNSLTDALIHTHQGGTGALFENTQVLLELKSAFEKCNAVAFDDWANIHAAATLWPVFFSSVISTLKDKPMEFIFYMGIPTGKFSFQIEEVLKTISDFCSKGSVTLALDELEAITLWQILNGETLRHQDPNRRVSNLPRKFLSLYKTIDIHQLLIYSTSKASLYSKQGQFSMARRIERSDVEMSSNARRNFIYGYTAGLLLSRQLSHNILLGLATFGAAGVGSGLPGEHLVFAYLDEWLDRMDNQTSLSLYQE